MNPFSRLIIAILVLSWTGTVQAIPSESVPSADVPLVTNPHDGNLLDHLAVAWSDWHELVMTPSWEWVTGGMFFPGITQGASGARESSVVSLSVAISGTQVSFAVDPLDTATQVEKEKNLDCALTETRCDAAADKKGSPGKNPPRSEAKKFALMTLGLLMGYKSRYNR